MAANQNYCNVLKFRISTATVLDDPKQAEGPEKTTPSRVNQGVGTNVALEFEGSAWPRPLRPGHRGRFFSKNMPELCAV